MPGGDRTGPMGLGPMSGWGAGFCHGYDRSSYANPNPEWFYRSRFGRGGFFGRGRGWRHCYYLTGLPSWARAGGGATAPFGPAPYPPSSPEEEVEELKAQAGYFEESLKKVKKYIAELEEQAGKED